MSAAAERFTLEQQTRVLIAGLEACEKYLEYREKQDRHFMYYSLAGMGLAFAGMGLVINKLLQK